MFGIVFAVVYVPHWFLIPYPNPALGQMLLAGKPYYTTYVDYSFLFEPFNEWARQYIHETHKLPLWNSSALAGLPMIEQSDHCILNPIQWLCWAGNSNWRILVTTCCLFWGAWGLFNLLSGCLCHSRTLSFGCVILYALDGASPHALGYFSCLMHVMCLPHIVRYAVELADKRQRAVKNFLGLVIYVTLLLLSGQPQYLLVSGLFVMLLLITYSLFNGNFRAPLLFVSAGVASLLLAAPAIIPFLQANLSGIAYPGNHQLVGSASFWKMGPIAFSQLFCNRLLGFVGTTWYASTSPSLVMSYAYESFPISMGAVGSMAALAGSTAGLRYLFRKKRTSAAALRLAVSLTTLAAIGMLLLHNLSPINSYPWLFRFVNLNKYCTPVLAFLICLVMPYGLRVFASSGWLLRRILEVTATAIPSIFLIYIFRGGARIVSTELLCYSLAATFLPIGGLIFVGYCIDRETETRVKRALCAVIVGEALLLCSWGMPLHFEYFRMSAVGMVIAVVFLVSKLPERRILIISPVAILCITGLFLVRGQSTYDPFPTTSYTDLAKFTKKQERALGYKPRILTTRLMTAFPYNGIYGLRTLVARCPVVPQATQGLLFDYADPDVLIRRQRKYSFLGFDGAVAPDSSGNISWMDFAQNPQLFDLLGIDYLADYRDGWLKKNKALFRDSFSESEIAGGDLYVLARKSAKGRVSFAPKFDTEPYTPDGWYARRRLREEKSKSENTPIAEIAYNDATKWENYVVHQLFEFPPNASSDIKVKYLVDQDGLFSADVTTDGPGLVVFKEQYWPGWKASVNGVSAPDVRVNSIFQGVILLGGGTSRVTFEYVGSLYRDLMVTLVGLASAVCVALFLRSPSKPIESGV